MTETCARSTDQQKGIPGTLPRVLYRNVQWQDEYGVAGWDRQQVSSAIAAEVVSSELTGSTCGVDVCHNNAHLRRGLHAPVLDIDYPATLVPSSTPGHFHLYLDTPMPWRRYRRLLRALARAGVIEEGYAKASIRRKHTAVRVPWLRKAEK